MTAELLAILVILPTVAVLVAGTWWLSVKLVPPGPRKLVQWYYPAIVLILGLYFVGGSIARRVEQGDCVCIVCGRSAGFVTLGPIRIQVPLEVSRGVGDSDVYERAFPQSASGPHHHEWVRVGCFSKGAFVPPFITEVVTCCTMIESCAWFRDLPELHDRELARSYAVRLARGSVGEQCLALHSFDFVANEKSDPELAFGTWREEWRRNHPDWP